MRPRPSPAATLTAVLVIPSLVGVLAIRALAQGASSGAKLAEAGPAAIGPSLLEIVIVLLAGLIVQGAAVVVLLKLQTTKTADQMSDQLRELAATAGKLQLLMNRTEESLRFLNAKVAEAVGKGLHDVWPDLGGRQLTLIAAELKARGEVAEATSMTLRSGLDACCEAASQAVDRAAEATAAVAGIRTELEQAAARARELLQAIAATTESADHRLSSLAEAVAHDPWSPAKPELLHSLRRACDEPVDPREAAELASDAVNAMRDEGLLLAADWVQAHGLSPLSHFMAVLGRSAAELSSLAAEPEAPAAAALAGLAAWLADGADDALASPGRAAPHVPDRYGGFRLLIEGLGSLRSRCVAYVREREGFAAIGRQGERLDPSRHEVAGGRPTPSVSLHDTVAEVVRPGLMKGEQIVFPARVVVFCDPSIPNPYTWAG